MLVNIYSPETLSNSTCFNSSIYYRLFFFKYPLHLPACFNPHIIIFTNIPTYRHILFAIYSYLSLNFYWSLPAVPETDIKGKEGGSV